MHVDDDDDLGGPAVTERYTLLEMIARLLYHHRPIPNHIDPDPVPHPTPTDKDPADLRPWDPYTICRRVGGGYLYEYYRDRYPHEPEGRGRYGRILVATDSGRKEGLIPHAGMLALLDPEGGALTYDEWCRLRKLPPEDRDRMRAQIAAAAKAGARPRPRSAHGTTRGSRVQSRVTSADTSRAHSRATSAATSRRASHVGDDYYPHPPPAVLASQIMAGLNSYTRQSSPEKKSAMLRPVSALAHAHTSGYLDTGDPGASAGAPGAGEASGRGSLKPKKSTTFENS